LKIVFFIKSETIDLNNFSLKDPLGSSGRLDVIVRCALAALLNNYELEDNIEFWTFLDNYGTYIFKSSLFDQSTFPIGELKFMEYFIEILKGVDKESIVKNPLKEVIISNTDIMSAIENLKKEVFKEFILHESGNKITPQLFTDATKFLFIIGNQSGDFLDSKQILSSNIPRISLGEISYLSSSVIKLIKTELLD
jgi:tRNA pseudouridine-54 N-methylase